MNSNNPWKNLSVEAPFILPADKVQVARFNERYEADDYRLRTNLPPLPFQGRKDAPVVLLGLNPGFATSDEKNHLEDDFIAANWRNYAHDHENDTYPFFFLDPRYTGDAGQQWWHRRLSHLRQASKHNGSFTDEQLANTLLCVQYFPYRSKSYKSMPQLESQQYGFDLVQAAIDRKALIILLRSREIWLKAVPSLKGYENLLELSAPLNPVLSPGQLKDGGWEKLVATLAAAV